MQAAIRQYPHFFVIALICLIPIVSSPVALIVGMVLAHLGWAPKSAQLAKPTKLLLSVSIVGLGFGIHLDSAIEMTQTHLGLIISSIVATLLLAFILTKTMKIDPKSGYLIGAGTAICGGSAIAAVAPAIDAKQQQTALALATVFILNSIALFVFPVVGHLLDLSQQQFGIWAAIAIHDTSSVVGAASSYGSEALTTATTVKLARALWIIPLAFISALLFGGSRNKIKVPWFIGFYCLAIAISYYFPAAEQAYQWIFELSKRLLVVCLMLIGAAITVQQMRQAGGKTLLLGVMLWLAISCGSLLYIMHH
ncbi:YeiH family protein [Paraferrimonas haliotis]|uniref:UPF0324 membrane protein n=1 Tax=Paraferrimonas haliotis TaxID=2013866 RepID=A0AA37TYI3_9GAMM|nr:putative sulfate exporter family transporter [Paraferrimonas haliotis]GLS84954.1 UPF0324 membrane protein [Paraferrimonas haliotis]